MTIHLGRRLAAALGTTLLSITLIACGGTTATAAPVTAAPSPSTEATLAASPSASPASSATPGASLATTGRIEFPDKGFAVTLPDGWTRIDLESGDLEALLTAAGASNPALAEAYSGQIKALLASGLVLFAFGPNPMAGTNLNILAVPSLGVSMDLMEQATVAQLKSVAQGEVASERVMLPAGEALHLKYAVAAEGVPNAPTVDQYVVLTDTSQIIVSATNAEPADALAIAQSIELLN
jgi:hypothetical protein